MPDQSSAFLVEQIVRATLDHGGTTADLRTMKIVPAIDAWYFPRFPERTMIVALTDLDSSVSRFIEVHRETLITGNLWLGTWINPETRACYLDLITRTADQHEALHLARRYSRDGGRKIIAICNPSRRQTLDVDSADLDNA
jgi:hypothetical protein